MFQASYNKITKGNLENYAVEKILKIDEEITAFIIIDCDEQRIGDIILNKTVDYILDNINPDSKDIYDSFSSVLDILNGFLKSLNLKNEKTSILNISIGILEGNKFHFSKIGQACVFLLKDGEISEVSQSNTNDLKQTEFSYISSGALRQDDFIIMSNDKLLNYLTKSDFLETYNKSIEDISSNIENILNNENIKRNIVFILFKYKTGEKKEAKNKLLEKIKHFGFVLLDNNYSKKIIAWSLFVKDKLNINDKVFKNIIFISGLLVSISVLYFIIGSVVSQTNTSMSISQSKQKLIEAREYLRVANENINNPDLFDLNIKKAEEIVLDIKNKKLFLNDVDKIIDDISNIKKQFDGIESFESSSSNLIYRTEEKGFIKILELNNKIYLLNSDFIIGPIVSGQKPKKYVFDKLDNDSFIDGKVLGDKLILLTKNTKIVSFDKNFEFKFINVLGQDKWESSKLFETFGTNIYLVDNKKNQIFKHKIAINGYTIGQGLLKDEDLKNIGKIETIAIDGGIYILKNDLSLIKLFTSPKYKIESIVLNKLPKNYKAMNPKNSTIITKDNLNYLYMLINNTIFVFEPNSKRYQDVNRLNYIGQIEGKKYPIISINIKRDGEIDVLNETGLYKLNFEVSDGKLMLK